MNRLDRRKIDKSSQVTQYLRTFVTDEIELSNYFLEDLKNLATTAENIFKKVQNKLQDKIS